MNHNYFVYILTNKNRTVIYTGVTNDLQTRLKQHVEGSNKFAFTTKYNCYYLIFFERYQYIEHAIDREKEIKGWTRARKNALIETENPDWKFMNDEILSE
ncbi:GIY-YIG nuclease family protein [Pedobacter endophyticus]|uniref:GIY-YIG nuclease family protein n=1 Tax=Pedobacter endophyticus TaxID=2789740 RepID=A0A7U3SPH1_9SPHI|nr:GIY-YIG nuclease family protein [Pedobacter endophyticus]QPH38061.1 GIY-YIG nuclease family protein [Pedobacter endophyticus]